MRRSWWGERRRGLLHAHVARSVAESTRSLELDEIAGGHFPMLSRPAELARRLVDLHDERR
jgi:pimeloyl-ACP methyl ester carboxylesterase